MVLASLATSHLGGGGPVASREWHLGDGSLLGPVLVWQAPRGPRSCICELSLSVLAETVPVILRDCCPLEYHCALCIKRKSQTWCGPQKLEHVLDNEGIHSLNCLLLE